MRWFKHDSDASRDAKLEKLQIKYGMEGYGLYWYCLELIAREINHDNLTFELEHDAEIISHRVGMHYEKVQDIMTFMVNLGLFELNDHGVITCLKMLKRMDTSVTSSPQFRSMITKAKNGLKSENHDEVMTESRQHHDAVMTISRCSHDEVMKEKNRIEKNRKEYKHNSNFKRQKLPVSASRVVEIYHEVCSDLPKCEKLTNTRRGYIDQRTRDDLIDENHWRNYFEYVIQSKFLTGRIEPVNGRRPFKANLEWLTKEGNFAKVYEGRYHE